MGRLILAVLLSGAVLYSAGALAQTAPAGADNSTRTRELAAQAQRRPHVIIRPRRFGPNAKRICQAWLAQEYRPSGPVITPQMRCWWEQ